MIKGGFGTEKDCKITKVVRFTLIKTKLRKEVESLVKLTQCLDNEIRGNTVLIHNLKDCFEALLKHLELEIEIKKEIPRRIIVNKCLKQKE